MKHYTARMHQDLFGSSTATVHNVFFALMPDEVTRERMARAVDSLKAQQDPQGRWLKPARYHMTLHFLGAFSELPREQVAAACKAAGNVELPPFDLLLDRMGYFSQGVGWLGCERADPLLQHLWEALRRALVQERVAVRGHAAFVPHVTVLRDARRTLPVQPMEPIRWRVREFVLIDSQLGERNEYRALGRWALGEGT
jgi:2'-5' RNA ligase